MAATINTNIASINAQRNLSLSGQSLNTTMQRLSSGLRVNSAKDDAAGLAIAERMNTQVKGLTVASRNANDGISLAQTAEGALGKVGDMLQRMRELAVQASNATNSASDRTALQAEVSQLAAEIDRVAKQTNFNGQKILDGSFAGAVFQVGANSGDNVTLGALADTRSSKLSIVNYAQNTVSFDVNDTPTPAIKDYAVAIPAGELKISIGSTPPQTIELDAIKPATSSLERLGQVVTAINSKSTDTGVTAYMSRDNTTGEYKIEMMSEKASPEGKPFSVSFTNFKQSTTGIGLPTKAIWTPLTTSPIYDGSLATAATNLSTAAIDGATGEDLTDIIAYRDHLAKINTALGTSPAPFDLTALNGAITAYTAAAAESPTIGSKLNTQATIINTQLAAIAASLAPTGSNANIATTISNHNSLVGKTPSSVINALSEISTVTEFTDAITTLGSIGFDVSTTKPSFSLAKYTGTPTPGEWNGAPPSINEALATLDEILSQQTSGGLNFSSLDSKENQRGLDSIDVTTQEGAWVALKKIDSAIDQINGARATLGAMQTRFETAVNNIDIQVENLSAARGRIMDADFAVETANLSRTQILQQAGTAMVAQANQIPQNVLQLLQG